jgi:hypothetical protein
LIIQWKALFRNHSPELSAGSRLRDNIDWARCSDGKVLNRLQQAKAGGTDRVLTTARDIYTGPEYTKYLQVVAEIIADSEKLAPLLEKNKDTVWRTVATSALEKYDSLIPVIVGATNLSTFHFQRAMRIPMLLKAMKKLAPVEHKINIKNLFLSVKALTMQMQTRQDFLVKYRDRLIYFSDKKPDSKLKGSKKQELAELWKALNEFKNQGFNPEDLKGVDFPTLSQLYQGIQSATSESTGHSPQSRELMKELMQSPVMRRRNDEE